MLTPELLNAVRAEISEHEAALAKLRDVERLLAELVPTVPAVAEPRLPASPAPAARRRTAGPRRPPGAAAERRRAILATLSTRGPLSPTEIGEAIGEQASTISGDLAQLRASSKVVGQGATSSRTYDVARNGSGGGLQLPERPVEEALLDAAGVDSL